MKVRAIKTGEPDKKNTSGGSAAIVTRDNNGNTVAIRKGDFGGIDDKAIKQANANAANANPNKSKEYAFQKSTAASGAATKKQMKVSMRNSRDSDASPQAKKAARRNFKIKGQ